MKFLLLLMAVSITSMVSGQTALPYEQTFDDETIPPGWTTQQNTGHDDPSFTWQFGTDVSTGSAVALEWDNSPALNGNYAILNNGSRTPGEIRNDSKNLDLISPNFALVEGAMLFLQFKHFFYWENDAVGTLSYSTDDGTNWETIATYNSRSANPKELNYTIEGLIGASQIKFKWNYTGTLNWGWAIDDVLVAENDSRTWLGSVDTDWNEAGNWNPAGVPGANTTASIPNGLTDYPVVSGEASCYKLIMDANASLIIGAQASLTVYDEFAPAGLTLESSAAGTGSLIAGSVAGNPDSEIQRYIEDNTRWYNISSPVEQSISSFLNTNTTIPTKDTDKRGMMSFNTTGDAWNDFFTASSVESFQRGKGYSARTNTASAITFTGPITAGTVNVPLSRDNYRWNLVGNPYTSAIILNRSGINPSTFLRTNRSLLEDAYVAVYAWVDGTYVAVNLASGDWNASIGQGFFVKAKTGSTGDLTFTPDMKVHDTGVTLKSGTIIPEIQLEVSNSEKTTSTQIKFIEKMTTGLDVGYDAGILKADPDFAVFTRLVNDNNIEFMLQCLPMPSKEAMVIPVGIDFRAGGEITFSAKMLNLPEESSVVLEDRLLEKFTAFDNSNSEYKATIAANAESTGRFYLHVAGKSQVTAIDREANLKTVNAWMERNEIVISGTTGDNAVVRLFDIQGRSVLTRNLERTSVNRINASGINPGIYMLQVIENGKRTGIKLSISGN